MSVASAHLDQARIRAADLRQQVRAGIAQQAEQPAWGNVDPNSREQLRDYLPRFSSGSHAQQGRARIAELDRQATDVLTSQRFKEQKDQKQARRNADLQMIGKLLADFEAAYNRRAPRHCSDSGSASRRTPTASSSGKRRT